MRRSLGIGSAACLAALAVLVGVQVSHAQLMPMSADQLAQESEAIVRGKVLDTESAWNEEKNFIYTFVTLAVEESLKGEDLAGREIKIRVPGGEVGEVGLKSSDQVVFEVGEESVVFLGTVEYQGETYFDVPRMVTGKLTVKDGMIGEESIESYMQQVSAAVESQMKAKEMEEGEEEGGG